MTYLTNQAINQSKAFIYQNGRLLERYLFAYFFEKGAKEACLKALLAYQNPDGGFGNGIEPDLLCPDSSAIGAETALAILDLLDYQDTEILDPLVDWLLANQDGAGFITHPPQNMANYPHQPWWAGPDRNRVLVIAALLKKRGVERDDFFSRARNYYERTEIPEPDDFYSYPFFTYLRYCGAGEADKARLDRWVTQLPHLLEKQRDHFPLFGRHWLFARDFVDRETLKGEAAAFIAALEEDGGVTTPYPEMPWWRPIFTLDGLIMLKKSGLIGDH